MRRDLDRASAVLDRGSAVAGGQERSLSLRPAARNPHIGDHGDGRIRADDTDALLTIDHVGKR
jgi:hypothetical protein